MISNPRTSKKVYLTCSAVLYQDSNFVVILRKLCFECNVRKISIVYHQKSWAEVKIIPLYLLLLTQKMRQNVTELRTFLSAHFGKVELLNSFHFWTASDRWYQILVHKNKKSSANVSCWKVVTRNSESWNVCIDQLVSDF